MFRVGCGFDIHRLEEGRKLIIGGVEVSHKKGSVAHSDGDVLIHSVVDALLGAVSERDIGFHFPDTSKDTINISGMEILRKTLEILSKCKAKVINIDATIICNEPKISPHVESIKEGLSKIISIDKKFISIKGKTTEDFFYSDNGIMVFSVVLVEIKD